MEKGLKSLLEAFGSRTASSPRQAKPPMVAKPHQSPQHTYFGVEGATTHFVGAALAGPSSFSQADFAALKVAASIAQTNFLHTQVRETGGAYGVSSDPSHNAFEFSSYRDPSPVATVNAFQEAIRWLASGSFTDENLDDAVISIFGSIQRPQHPASRGAYLVSGQSHADQVERRQAFLAVNRHTIQDAVQRWLVDKPMHVAVVGPPMEGSGLTGFEYRNFQTLHLKK
jgi:Zn-dependent M16 (insulinase) family peptidase